MLTSPAMMAASHLQRSMVWALVAELGRHSGKNNGRLIVTNRDLQKLGFSRDAIKPNLCAIETLGFISFKRGRPGTKGYGWARRFRITFLPTLDANGIEAEAPTDEWEQWTTTRQAKQAARAAYKRAQSSNLRSRNRTTLHVVQKSDHVATPYNHGLRSKKARKH